MRKIDWIILHCSASTYPEQTASWIDKIHKSERGFDSIGYHFFIRYNGLIESGRPISIDGAHAAGYNHNSIGICLAGLKKFTKIQFKSLQLLLELLKGLPQCNHATIIPHNQVNKDKTCPNFDVSPLVLL